jgi:hypothetical protein
MEGTSKDDDLFTADESKDETTTDATPIKQQSRGNNDDDYEALMAALEANREWLQAKVSINNALEATTAHMPPAHGECEGQKTLIDGERMPLDTGKGGAQGSRGYICKGAGAERS